MSISVEFELSAQELTRGLRASRRFRRQVALLALLTLPSLVALSMWPSFRWWMVPPIVALLAYRALQVPARAARRALAGKAKHAVRLRADETNLFVTGALEADAPWSEVRATSETTGEVVLEVGRGPVVVIPKRALGQAEHDRLLRYANHV
jgi:hypothetical protein